VSSSDLELPFECPTDFFIQPKLLGELPIRLPGYLSQLQVTISIHFGDSSLSDFIKVSTS
jgi:hypothetical protein